MGEGGALPFLTGVWAGGAAIPGGREHRWRPELEERRLMRSPGTRGASWGGAEDGDVCYRLWG